MNFVSKEHPMPGVPGHLHLGLTNLVMNNAPESIEEGPKNPDYIEYFNY